MGDLADPNIEVVCRGPVCVVAYAVDSAGRMNARTFLESEQVPDKDKARLLRWMQFMSAYGPQQIKGDAWRKERGEIWAFKSFQSRVGAFWYGRRRLWLTHGFQKKSDKWPPTELDRADRIREEHIKLRGQQG